MTQLTDPQRELLARAAADPDGVIDAPEDAKLTRSLIKKGLVIAMPVADGPSRLLLTTTGRAAIEPSVEAPVTEAAEPSPASDAEAAADTEDPSADVPGAHGDEATAAAPTPAPAARKGPPGGKLGKLAELLQRPQGATLEEMTAATGWQVHSVRGAMSGGLKKGFGYTIATEKTDGGRTYRITGQEIGLMTSIDPDVVAAKVRALEALNIDGLRDEWRRRFRAPPPALRAPDLMRRMLAERIQTEAFGRDLELERRIAALVRRYQRAEGPKAPRATFRPGTLLEREHQGRTHRVEVTESGFRFDGRPYKSLSVIAREITGVRWNGPRFFGLREAKAGAAR